VSNIKLATEAGIFKKCFWNDHGFVLEECMKIQMYSLRHLWSVNWSTVQHTDSNSQWERRYRSQAITVCSHYNDRSHRAVQSKIIFFLIRVVYTKAVQYVNLPKNILENRCAKCGMIFLEDIQFFQHLRRQNILDCLHFTSASV
jgi:hypothetical protein